MARIAVINGHPDASPERFCAGLTEAYGTAAQAAGHQVTGFAVGAHTVPLLKNEAEFEAPPPPEFEEAREAIRAADHLVLIFPLWFGTMPAALKAYLEQLGRDNFFIGPTEGPGFPAKKMRGKSARIIVTMGMPALAYRFIFGAHSVKALEGAILGLAGFKPVRHSLCGTVADAKQRQRMLSTVTALGQEGR